MDISHKTREEVIDFIKEDQDEAITDFVTERLENGEFRLSWNEDDWCWTVRGDYHDLLRVGDQGVEVNDELLRRIFGTADPRLI